VEAVQVALREVVHRPARADDQCGDAADEESAASRLQRLAGLAVMDGGRPEVQRQESPEDHGHRGVDVE
jgi:hypothetical protein